jgi:membrane protease YdiL (CAAX protease family)
LSDWLGQLFGNGFFLVIALLFSQGFFAFGHVIVNMKNPERQWLLTAQFVFGLLVAAVYLRTGNLLLAIGIDALINNPAPMLSNPLDGPGVTGTIVLVGSLLWLCIWPWWSRSQTKLPKTRNDSGVR